MEFTMSKIQAFLLTLALAVAAAGCTLPSEERPSVDELVDAAQANAEEQAGVPQNDGDGDGEGSDDAGQAEPDGSGADGSPAPAQQGTETSPGSGEASEPNEPATPSSPEASPSEAQPSGTSPVEQHSDFPITASLDRDCVTLGGEITITVDAGENTGVAYQAMYHGGESGAEPPYGDGHGGNGGDMTDDDGQFEETWVVSPTAPIGPAWVDVVAGRDGGYSTTTVPFEVADPASGGCG